MRYNRLKPSDIEFFRKFINHVGDNLWSAAVQSNTSESLKYYYRADLTGPTVLLKALCSGDNLRIVVNLEDAI